MNKRYAAALRFSGYALAFLAPIVALGVIGFRSTVALASKPAHWAVLPKGEAASASPKPFDPAKPTVAILLADDQTEITDVLIPYQLFSATRAYNVYAVAPERRLTTLSGGLEVMPDYSYDELKSLLGKSPDVVLVPAFPHVEGAQNQPVLAWIKQQSSNGSFLFSICAGAEPFAATGLL
ncbi:MAG: DJ-1/PfpI family protein, partial [Gemmatimonadales bacterium]